MGDARRFGWRALCGIGRTGLLVYSAVDIAVAVALRDDTTLMPAGKVPIAFFGSTDRGCALVRDRDGHEGWEVFFHLREIISF